MLGHAQKPKRNRPSTRYTKERVNKVYEPNERLKKFQRFLENRGCPTRLVYQSTDKDIRWLD